MSASNVLDVRRTDLRTEYRPQREWIDGRGMLIVIAHFFSGIGAGAWLFSVWLDFTAGMVAGLVCVGALSGLAHLLFLGRFERFWRMLKRPHKSWISRGIWGIGVFGVGAVGTLVGPEAWQGAMVGASLVGCAIILLYEGFVYAASRAIPFWRTRLLPVLYIAYGLRGGAAVLLVLAALGGTFQLAPIEAIKLWVVASTGVLVLLYLVSASRAGGAAAHSVRRLIAGSISPAFYGGTVLLGLLVPLGLGLARELGSGGLAVLALIGVSSLIGDFYVKYCVVKAGTYVPLRGFGDVPNVPPVPTSGGTG
jgi:formate-dependent nitrite reductase membrane component NrfD